MMILGRNDFLIDVGLFLMTVANIGSKIYLYIEKSSTKISVKVD